MKRNLLYIALVGICTLAACSQEPVEPGVAQNEKPQWVVNTTDANINSMMVLVVDSGLPTATTADDLLAAFVNGTCRGLANPIGQDGVTRFFLAVTPSVAECQTNPLNVSLQYYSAGKKRIYTSQPFTFEGNGILGTLQTGYRPQWEK